MMSWICSECGSECSPLEQDCPTCAGRPLVAIHITVAESHDALIETNHGAGLYGEEAEFDQLWSALEMLSAESLAHVEGAAQVTRVLAEESTKAEHQAEEEAIAPVAKERQPEETIATELEPVAVAAPMEEISAPEADRRQAAATDHQPEETIATELEPVAVAAALAGCGESLDDTPTTGENDCPTTRNQQHASRVRQASWPGLDSVVGSTPSSARDPVVALGASAPRLYEPLNGVGAFFGSPPEETIATESEPLAVAAPLAGCGESLVDTQRIGGDACPTTRNLGQTTMLEPEAVTVAASVEEIPTPESDALPVVAADHQAELVVPAVNERDLQLLNEALLVLAEDSLPPVEHEIAVPGIQPYVLADRLSPINLPTPVPGRSVTPVVPTGGLAIPAGLLAREFPIPGFRALPPVYSRRKAGLPSWAITMVAAVVVTLVIASLIQKLSSNEPAASAAAPPLAKHAVAQTYKTHEAMKPAPPAPEPGPEAAPEPEAEEAPRPKVEPTTPVPTPAKEYPYARFVEVMELKVVQENNRPQVQYFVVNTAERELNDIALRIDVRSSTAAQGTSPLFSVAAWVPKLAPHQSKEIRTDLDPGLTAAQIPKPANLRAEVRVTSQQ